MFHFAPQAENFEYRGGHLAISRGKLRFILRRRRKILNHIGGHLMISEGKLWFILRRRRNFFDGISDPGDPDPQLTPPPCFPEKGERGGGQLEVYPLMSKSKPKFSMPKK